MNRYIRIEEISDFKKVNQYLEYGWSLIDTYVVFVKNEPRQEEIRYVVGWYLDPLIYNDTSPKYPKKDPKPLPTNKPSDLF